MGEVAKKEGSLTKVNNKKEAFLAAYAECGVINTACKAVGISRTMHYNWMIEDPEYPKRFQHANDDALDALETVARNRAIAGSDNLLMFTLKAGRPHKFRDNAVIEIRDTRVQIPADERERRIQELLKQRMMEIDITPTNND
jgi:hypothetical protein